MSLTDGNSLRVVRGLLRRIRVLRNARVSDTAAQMEDDPHYPAMTPYQRAGVDAPNVSSGHGYRRHPTAPTLVFLRVQRDGPDAVRDLDLRIGAPRMQVKQRAQQ